MSPFQSRSASRARELERRAANPLNAVLTDSRRLFDNLSDPAAPGRTMAEAVQHVLTHERVELKQCASYRMLEKLLPLL